MDAREAAAAQVCSVARTAAVLSDPWTVLVVRDLGRGVHRFDDLVRGLGVARTVLSRRLATLAEAGVVERVDYREPGSRTRAEYRLTRRGRDLGVVVAALMDFGDRHLADAAGPPVLRVHEDCGAPVRLVSVCADGHRLGAGDRVLLRPGPGAPARDPDLDPDPNPDQEQR